MAYPTPKRGHFVLHSQRPAAGDGRATTSCVTDQTGLPFDVEPRSARTSPCRRRATRCRPTRSCRASRRPTPRARSATGCRRSCSSGARCRGSATRPAAARSSPTPWLALVVVAEGEARAVDGHAGRRSASRRAPRCSTPATRTSSRASTSRSPRPWCSKIFPRQEDLPLLTHVREVDVSDTELANGDDDGWLAVVLANRLPVFDTAQRQAGALPGLPRQPRGPARRAAAADAAGRPLRVRAGAGLARARDDRPADQHADHVRDGRLDVAGHRAAVGRAGGRAARRRRAPRRSPRPAPRPRRSAPRSTARRRCADVAVGRAVGAARPRRSPPRRATRTPSCWSATRWASASATRSSCYAAEKVLRFPVLAHWSFTTTEGATFETLMQDLDVGLLGTRARAGAGRAAGAAPAPTGRARPATSGSSHRTRRGDAVRRLVPRPAACRTRPRATARRRRPAAGRPRRRPAAPRRARRARGPLARRRLRDRPAARRCRSCRSSPRCCASARAVRRRPGRARSSTELVPVRRCPSSSTERIDLGRFVAVAGCSTSWPSSPSAMSGPRRPVADPGRPIELAGDLDAVIASGLGLRPRRARRRPRDAVGHASPRSATTDGARRAGRRGPARRRAVAAALRAALRRRGAAHRRRRRRRTVGGATRPASAGARRRGAAPRRRRCARRR